MDGRYVLSLQRPRRRAAILDAWRNAIKRDPALSTGDSLPRVQLFDHIPALLSTFERGLRQAAPDGVASTRDAAQESAAAHGLQRWQQGYDLREVTRELGKLNECVVAELDAYTAANPQISHAVVAAARRVWAALCSAGIEESVGQYFQLQQQEAAGHVRDLESALSDIQELEKQRADLWRQAAHDLRGNLGVVANATVGLAQGDPVAAERQAKKSMRDEAGEGIGLSIVKRLCELLDATIELNSQKDVGTTFRILFPRKYLN